MQSYLISTTLSQGWRGGIVVIFSPLVTDVPIIILMTVILSQIPEPLQRALQFGGGLFVLYLAWGMFRAWQANTLIKVDNPAERGRTLGQAVVMNFLSPGPYIFWGSVTGPLLVQGLEESVLHGAAFLLAFYGTFMSIMALLVVIFDRLRRFGVEITRGILLIAILVLAGLGILLVFQSITT